MRVCVCDGAGLVSFFHPRRVHLSRLLIQTANRVASAMRDSPSTPEELCAGSGLSPSPCARCRCRELSAPPSPPPPPAVVVAPPAAAAAAPAAPVSGICSLLSARSDAKGRYSPGNRAAVSHLRRTKHGCRARRRAECIVPSLGLNEGESDVKVVGDGAAADHLGG